MIIVLLLVNGRPSVPCMVSAYGESYYVVLVFWMTVLNHDVNRDEDWIQTQPVCGKTHNLTTITIHDTFRWPATASE